MHVKEWENALIGYVIGDSVYENQMKEYVKKDWDLLLHHMSYTMMMDIMFLNFIILLTKRK